MLPGAIVSIDQSTAYSWLECDVCGQSDLVSMNMRFVNLESKILVSNVPPVCVCVCVCASHSQMALSTILFLELYVRIEPS